MWRTTIVLAACLVGRAGDAKGQERPADPKEFEAAYARTLEKRAADILAELKLEDPATEGRVRDRIIAQYRGLHAIQEAREAKVRVIKERKEPDQDDRIAAEKAVSEVAASALNDRFLSSLAEDLPREGLETVKDKMTYHKLQVTERGYTEMLPTLTERQKGVIRVTLTQARDRAAYAGSAEEKTALFDKAKGRINNYLAAQGYDLKQASKDWAERRKAAAK